MYSIDKVFLLNRLVQKYHIPPYVDDIIKSYCFIPIYIYTHNKKMHKISYIFKNAKNSRRILEDKRTTWIGNQADFDLSFQPNGEQWTVDLSRKISTRMKPLAIRAKETSLQLIKLIDENTPQYDARTKLIQDTVYKSYKKKQQKLKEKKFGKTNCKKCGNYKNINNFLELYSKKTCKRALYFQCQSQPHNHYWQLSENSIFNTCNKLLCICDY